MQTRRLKPRKNGVNPKKLNPKELLFCHALMASRDFSAVEAVREVYPNNKNPHSQASKLLSRPRIQKMVGKLIGERCRRLELKADDVLEYLRNALYFNPLEYFHPTKDGKWLITDTSEIPDWVGRLIDKMKVKVVEMEDKTVSYFEVELVSKATALSLAMKHVGVEKHEIKHSIDWDSLVIPEDTIEARLIEEESK